MRKKRSKFFIGLIIALAILVSSCLGGYFVIDKLLVPKYFSVYGINDLSALVDIVKTIYIVPDEDDFITNPFSKADITSSQNKLYEAGFPCLKDGEIDYESIAKGDFTLSPAEDFEDNYILLTDKEVASIADNILTSGILVSNFPDLSYIDTLQMSIKQLSIIPNEKTKIEPQISEEPIENEQDKYLNFTTSGASIIATIKLNTESARKQIATNLNMPLFLIDWIIPNTIYVTSSIDTYISKDTGERLYKNATLAINSKTAKQSEVLLNLLISFIFPEDTVTIDELANQLGSLAINGIDILGNVEFASIKTNSITSQYGIKLYL